MADVVKLIHSDLTREIIGAGMDVHNDLGAGWDEFDYHRAMLKALSLRGLVVESLLRGKLFQRERVVDRFELDILVENKVVLELKHIRTNFAPEHYAQIINYLKFWNKDLGMLINFGLESLRFKRVPYSPVSGVCKTDGEWDQLEKDCSTQSRLLYDCCRAVLLGHGLGYGENSCRSLLFAECQAAGARIEVPSVELNFQGLSLGKNPISAFVLDGQIVVKVTALREQTTAADLARLLSYMRHSGISCGALVNFGRSELLIRAVIRNK